MKWMIDKCTYQTLHLMKLCHVTAKWMLLGRPALPSVALDLAREPPDLRFIECRFVPILWPDLFIESTPRNDRTFRMRLSTAVQLVYLLTPYLFGTVAGSPVFQAPLTGSLLSSGDRNITAELFVDLEELSRIVDISYCVGTTGIQKPFLCASRCTDFKGFELVTVGDLTRA